MIEYLTSKYIHYDVLTHYNEGTFGTFTQAAQEASIPRLADRSMTEGLAAKQYEGVSLFP